MAIVGSAYCPIDKRQVPIVRQGPNHVVHAIISVFTLGLWLPIWALIAIFDKPRSGRCSYCGTGFRYEKEHGWRMILAPAGWYRDAEGRRRWWTGSEWGRQEDG